MPLVWLLLPSDNELADSRIHPFPTESYSLTLSNYICDIASLQNSLQTDSLENRGLGLFEKSRHTLQFNLTFNFSLRVKDF